TTPEQAGQVIADVAGGAGMGPSPSPRQCRRSTRGWSAVHPARVTRPLRPAITRPSSPRSDPPAEPAMGAPAAAPRPRPALPRPRTRRVGRGREAAELRALRLDEGVRLLPLTGPGGVGKTRLAVAAAEDVAAAFPDGVRFVGLAAALRDRRLLLVLDNVE